MRSTEPQLGQTAVQTKMAVNPKVLASARIALLSPRSLLHLTLIALIAKLHLVYYIGIEYRFMMGKRAHHGIGQICGISDRG